MAQLKASVRASLSGSEAGVPILLTPRDSAYVDRENRDTINYGLNRFTSGL